MVGGIIKSKPTEFLLIQFFFLFYVKYHFFFHKSPDLKRIVRLAKKSFKSIFFICVPYFLNILLWKIKLHIVIFHPAVKKFVHITIFRKYLENQAKYKIKIW